MSPLKYCALSLVFATLHLALAQRPIAILKGTEPNGNPSSGNYRPPSLSLEQLMQNDHEIHRAMMTFMETGDSKAFRDTVMNAAQAGDIGAELFLAEQYIPEQCVFEPDHDVPHCGKNGNEPPQVVFRNNPLGVEASYGDAARWLEKASAQGSGEASEVLAQLITRMQANGRGTSYTVADSNRFHALARSQEFVVEAINVTCFKLKPGSGGIKLKRLPSFAVGEPPAKPFTDQEMAALESAGVSGSLEFAGSSGYGDAVLLSRPQGLPVRIRIIVDHDPGYEMLFPLPAHRDAIYLQRGDSIIGFPSEGPNLPRFISILPLGTPASQISFSIQTMDGGHSGGSCALLP